MSSLFQTLRKVKVDKKSRSKSSHKRRSQSKRSKNQKKKFFQDDDQLQTQYSQSSFTSNCPVKKGNVERIIGKACLDFSSNELFVFYLIKWENKSIKQSTWEDTLNLQHIYQKIKQFNQNMKPTYLPSFYKQYKYAEPDYQLILKRFIKNFKKTKNKQRLNLQSKSSGHNDEKVLQDYKKVKNSKTKKIKKKKQSKQFRRKQSKTQQCLVSKQTSLQDICKQQNRSFQKNQHVKKSHQTKRNKKQKNEREKLRFKDKKDKETQRLNKNIEKYFQQGRRNQQIQKEKKNKQLLIQSNKITCIQKFSKQLAFQKCEDRNQTEQFEKITNYQSETGQDFIFLSDTYKSEDFGILQESNQDNESEKSDQIYGNKIIKNDQEFQPGEIFLEEQTLLYSRLIEVQEGQFTDADFMNLTQFYA